MNTHFVRMDADLHLQRSHFEVKSFGKFMLHMHARVLSHAVALQWGFPLRERVNACRNLPPHADIITLIAKFEISHHHIYFTD